MRFLLVSISVILILLFTGCEEAAKALSTTISGNVYDDGAPIQGALVVLLAYGDSASSGLDLSNGSVTNSVGRYTILEVDPGDYYLCAIDDNDDNMNYDPGTDGIGYHGLVDSILGLTIPEKVTISEEGEDLDNIDVEELFVLPFK